jgi:putative phosphoserine phosphatase/1-acylglycerol-3-phosphate O-acyltransferase
MGIQAPAAGEEISVENTGLVVFDVDGTLLPGTSCERLFVKKLLRDRVLSLTHLLSFGVRAVALMRNGHNFALKANKGYLRGFSPDYMKETGKVFFEENVAKRISQKGISRIERHRRDGGRVMLLSGMPEFLLSNFSGYLGVGESVGSVLEVNSGRFTGRTIGTFPLAQGKVEALKPFLEKGDLAWSDVTAYADHILDRFLLEKVGRPVAVNPGDNLKLVAERRRWEQEIFD